MEESQPQKRKRPITICTECQRRKQKCDRQKPCGGCVARNVDQKCVYPSWPDHDTSPASDTKADASIVAVNLADSLGYSSLNKIKGTLDDLQHEYRTGHDTHGTGLRASENASESSTYDSLVARLPPSVVIDDIVSVCFAEADWYFCVLDKPYYDELYLLWKAHRPSLRTKINGTTRDAVFVRDPEELRYFPALLFQMLALTLHFLPASCVARENLKLKDYRAADKLSKYYSDTGAEIMTQLGRIDSPIAAVLADLLRCAWMKNSGLGTHSWHSLSDAIRQAQNLGMHEQQDILRNGPIDETIRELWYDEHRRRVWTSLFAWDAHMAVMLGRSRMIHAEDCTAKAPMDCDIPSNPSQVVPVPAIVSGRPSLYTSQLLKYTIALKLHEAMSSRALKSPCRDYNIITKLHDDVTVMLDNLPAYSRSINPDTSWDSQYPNLAKQRQQIVIVGTAFFLAIHRPHATVHLKSCQEAISAALRGLTAGQCLFELCDEHHYKIHTLVFYTIDAVIFLTSMVLMYCNPAAPSGASKIPIHDIRYALLQAVQRFGIMRHRSDVAREGEKVLRRCSDLVAKRERDFRSRPAKQQQQQQPPPPSSTTTRAAATQLSPPTNTSAGSYINFLTDPMPESSTTASSVSASSATPNRTPQSANLNTSLDNQGTYPATITTSTLPANTSASTLIPNESPLDFSGNGNGNGNMHFDIDLPLNLDLDLDLEPLPEYLHGVDFGKTNMAVWMERNGFVDDALMGSGLY